MPVQVLSLFGFMDQPETVNYLSVLPLLADRTEPGPSCCLVCALTSQPGPDHVVVRVVDVGAVVGPRVLSTQVVPLC
jgi:hypothetical protein